MGPYLRAAKGTSVGRQSRANSDVVVYEGAGKRYPIEEATFSPRVWNGILEYQVVEVPTPAPTTAAPTTGTFRLRLYWKRGYYWQESRREVWWCMECRNNCKSGDSIWVDHCDSSIRQQFFTVDGTIRPVDNPSLCITQTGYSESKPLRVYPCDKQSDQQWDGIKFDGRFELHPKGKSDRCVSQMHHPKRFEKVYPEDCRKTRRHDTTYWTMY
mgnify:CR=1 FL=1